VATAATAGAGTAAAPAAPGFILVANQQSASATLIELPSGASTSIPVGVGPHEAAISPDGRWGVVTIYGAQTPGNQLAVIDLAAKSVVRTIDLGEFRRPHGVVVLPDGLRAVVTSEASQQLVVVDLAAGTVEANIPTSARGSHMAAVTADGKRAYTANIPEGSISEFDLEARTFVREAAVATVTEGIAVTPDGSEVWVGSNDRGTVTVFDTRLGAVVDTIGGFRMPYRLAVSPNGALAAVCDPPANTIHIVDVKSRKVLRTVTGLGSPRGVTIGPDNRTAFVTLGDEGAVVIIDLVAGTVSGRHRVEASPDGVAYWTPGSR
jgi:YVTN family beta-propeller protein